MSKKCYNIVYCCYKKSQGFWAGIDKNELELNTLIKYFFVILVYFSVSRDAGKSSSGNQ